jgi:hypothetical protein
MPFHSSKSAVVPSHKGIAIMQAFIQSSCAAIDVVSNLIASMNLVWPAGIAARLVSTNS